MPTKKTKKLSPKTVSRRVIQLETELAEVRDRCTHKMSISEFRVYGEVWYECSGCRAHWDTKPKEFEHADDK